MGVKHSDKLRLTERIHLDKEDPNTLVVELTAEDPIALQKPWHNTLTFKRSRDQDLLEFICAENDRDPVDPSGHTGFNSASGVALPRRVVARSRRLRSDPGDECVR